MSVVWGGWPVKVNKMCSYWGFKAISDERAHDDGRFSVNFGPMKLIFGPLERGEQGLSTEPTFNFIGPKFAFFEAPENALKDQKGLPSLTGRRSQPQSIARPTFSP
jgi:hypothetical protein